MGFSLFYALYMSRERTAIKTTYFSIAGNTLLAVIKWLTGFFGNSYAMIADAIESTTDIVASFLVLMGNMPVNRQTKTILMAMAGQRPW